MFCFQCQETAKNTGCTIKGMCGKPEETANLQDLLIYILRGIAVYGEKAKELGISDKETGLFVGQALFATITNANFDNDRIVTMIKEALNLEIVIEEYTDIFVDRSLDSTKLREILEYQPPTWEEMIQGLSAEVGQYEEWRR